MTMTSTEHISRNNVETHFQLTRACVEHNAELRMTNAAVCTSKHNAELLHSKNQGVITTVQEDENYTRMEITSLCCV